MKRYALVALAALPILVLAVEGPPASTAPAAPPKPAAATAPASPTSPALVVSEAAFGTGVEKRVLQGQAETFPVATPRIYCLTRVTGGPSRPVVHAWFHEGNKVGEVPLAIDYPGTTTWSYKTLEASEKGAWRVDVLDADGAVLKSAAFTVQ
jgi:Protein of unknown function (DUF2914)